MKKLVSIFLALVSCAGLIACAEAGTNGGEERKDAEDKCVGYPLVEVTLPENNGREPFWDGNGDGEKDSFEWFDVGSGVIIQYLYFVDAKTGEKTQLLSTHSLSLLLHIGAVEGDDSALLLFDGTSAFRSEDGRSALVEPIAKVVRGDGAPTVSAYRDEGEGSVQFTVFEKGERVKKNFPLWEKEVGSLDNETLDAINDGSWSVDVTLWKTVPDGDGVRTEQRKKVLTGQTAKDLYRLFRDAAEKHGSTDHFDASHDEYIYDFFYTKNDGGKETVYFCGAFRAQRRNDAEYIAVKACVPHAETIYYSLTGVDFYDRMLSAVGDFQ